MAKKLAKKSKKLKESEDSKVPPTNAEAEDECKNSEAEDEDGDDSDGSGSDGDHDDKDQDVELIKKMMAKYLGDDAKDMSQDESEAMHSLGKQAYSAHQKMGKKPDDAFHHAGEAMKLAYHMSKNAEDESETEAEDEDGDAPPPPPAKGKGKKPAPKAPPPKGDAGDDSDGDSDSSEDEGESEDESESEDEKKESGRVKSLKNKLLETEGRLAALEAKDKQRSVDGYVNTKLKESKQPNTITKRFRETAGKIKSKADFDVKWKIFLEGVKHVSREEIDYGVLAEKSMFSEADGGEVTSSKKLDFSDCADEE